jgi:hypothetical protein
MLTSLLRQLKHAQKRFKVIPEECVAIKLEITKLIQLEQDYQAKVTFKT